MILSFELNCRLRYDVTTVSGGYMKLYDRDHSNDIMTRYYKGSTTSGYSTFTFDFDDPYHCVDVISGCRTTMLHAGDDVTSQVRFCRCSVFHSIRNCIESPSFHAKQSLLVCYQSK